MPKTLVTIYGKDGCTFCVRACQHLAQRRISYDYLNLTQRTDLIEEFIARTNSATTVPQVFIGDEHIGGYDDLVSLPLSVLQAKVGGS